MLRAPSFDDPGCFDEAVRLIAHHASELAAVVVEPLVQGAAGMLIAEADDVRKLGAACAEHDVLLICDEVATGFGRTGTLFASEQCGLRPDLLCIAKGITGGYLPMSATVANRRVYDAFLGADLGPRTFYHGHSYAGNALAAAVARCHLRLVTQPEVLENVRARSAQLRRLLEDHFGSHPAVRDIRICGLMAGVELAPTAPDLRWGRKVTAATVERGVLVRPIGDVIILVPPLTITASEIDRIVDALCAAIDEVGRAEGGADPGTMRTVGEGTAEP